MTKLVLTDRYIKALKPGPGRIEITDAGCRNLVLRCAPSGLKTWNYAYSVPGTAATDTRPAEKPKMQRITLGEYPAISLETARELAGQRRAQRKAGWDAKAEHDRERVVLKQTAIAFGELCDLYVQHAKANGKLSWETDEGYLSLARAKFRKRSAVSLTKVELVGFLENIRDGAHSIERLRASVIRLRDAHRRKADPLRKPRRTARKSAKVGPSKSSANRTQSVLRTLLGWAVEKDHLPVNVLAGVKKVGGKENEKDRVLTAEEIKVFMALLADPEATAVPAIRHALQVVLLTAQRPGEVAGMMLSELHDLDGDRPHWIIPRLRTKNKKTEHTVPLSPTAVRLIGEALAISKKQADEDGKPKANDQAVFASRFKNVACLSRNSLSQAVLAIVRDNKLLKFTPHDLRRTGATLAQSARMPTDFVKALLNHNDKGVTGIYARWHMFDEKLETTMAIDDAISPLMPQL